MVGGQIRLVGGDIRLVGGDIRLVGGDNRLVGGDNTLVGGVIRLVGGDIRRPCLLVESTLTIAVCFTSSERGQGHVGRRRRLFILVPDDAGVSCV